MHKFFVIVMCIFALGVNAQTKNTIARKRPTTTKNVIKQVKTDEEVAIEKAQVWFKEKYVETMFKDPYSYRVVGIKADSITYGKFIDKRVNRIKKEMEKCDIPIDERTQATAERYKVMARECDESLRETLSSDLRERYQKLKNECLLSAKKIELYLLQKEELKRYVETKEQMSTEQLNIFCFYDIHLDCYSKNDLGNEILGRFVFPFTKDGVYKDETTTLQMVVKIN